LSKAPTPDPEGALRTAKRRHQPAAPATEDTSANYSRRLELTRGELLLVRGDGGNG